MERLLGGSSLPASEQCHHLNVFTPGCDGLRRPVLVWMHGGAFVTGNGATPWYHGASLAALGDVVVVTINYRLGAFGFTGAFEPRHRRSGRGAGMGPPRRSGRSAAIPTT